MQLQQLFFTNEINQQKQDKIIPFLAQEFSLNHFVSRIISVVDFPESLLALTIEKWELSLPENISLSYLPVGNRVKLRLTATGNNAKDLEQLLDFTIGKVKPLIAIGTDGVEKQKEDIKGCISGDCANGYGIMEFPSGNRYEGNFKNYQFHGKGKMNFKGGNYVDAEFVEHTPKTGVFYYIEGDTKFTGTFGPDGQPLTGTYVSTATTGIVEVVNRSITSVKNPRQDSLIKALNEPQKMQCRSCGGKGGSGSTTPGSSTTLGGIGHTTPYNGYVTWDYPPQTFSRPSTYTYSSCSICNGKGYTTY